jgi:uncharacterized protein (DUF302 family)
MMLRRHPVCASLGYWAVAACLAMAGGARADDIVVQSKRGSYEEIKGAVVFAIENRGLVVNNTSRVGEMLERTGRDLGAGRVFVDAEVLEFCSATLSRRAMEADPHAIAFCPYTIAVYELPGEPGMVYVSYRRPVAPAASKAAPALTDLDKLLSGVVREALQ